MKFNPYISLYKLPSYTGHVSQRNIPQTTSKEYHASVASIRHHENTFSIHVGSMTLGKGHSGI